MSDAVHLPPSERAGFSFAKPGPSGRQKGGKVQAGLISRTKGRRLFNLDDSEDEEEITFKKAAPIDWSDDEDYLRLYGNQRPPSPAPSIESSHSQASQQTLTSQRDSRRSVTPHRGRGDTPRRDRSVTPFSDRRSATPRSGRSATPRSGRSATPRSGRSATPRSGRSATPHSGSGTPRGSRSPSASPSQSEPQINVPAAKKKRRSAASIRNQLSNEFLEAKIQTESHKAAYYEAGAMAMRNHSRAMEAAAIFYERQNQNTDNGDKNMSSVLSFC